MRTLGRWLGDEVGQRLHVGARVAQVGVEVQVVGTPLDEHDQLVGRQRRGRRRRTDGAQLAQQVVAGLLELVGLVVGSAGEAAGVVRDPAHVGRLGQLAPGRPRRVRRKARKAACT